MTTKPSTLRFLLLACSCFVIITHCTKKRLMNPKKKEGTNTPSILVAYTGVNLIDGLSVTIQNNQTVVVNTEQGTIEDLFTTGEKTLSPETEVKDMTGKFMLPGLIEGHFHLASGVRENTAPGLKSLINMFKQGITTVRDMAGNGEALSVLKDLGQKKRSPLPQGTFCLFNYWRRFYPT